MYDVLNLNLTKYARARQPRFPTNAFWYKTCTTIGLFCLSKAQCIVQTGRFQAGGHATMITRRPNRNLQTSKAPFEGQAHGISLFTSFSVTTNQRVFCSMGRCWKRTILLSSLHVF